MKRLLPLAAGIVALAIVAVVTTVAVGAGSDGSAKSARETDDAGDAPVAAVCAPDVPDCDDMIVNGQGASSRCAEEAVDCVDTSDGSMNMCVAPDNPGAADDPVAFPECSDMIDCAVADDAGCADVMPTEPGIAIDPICVDDGSGQCVDDGSGGPPSGPSTTYELTIAFNASVTQTDIDETTKVITSISPDTEFLVRESFPPVGAARVTTDMLSFCPDLEAKLESTSYVDNVTCVASGSSTNPSYPDAPVSSEPGSAE